MVARAHAAADTHSDDTRRVAKTEGIGGGQRARGEEAALTQAAARGTPGAVQHGGGPAAAAWRLRHDAAAARARARGARAQTEG